jgi:hypothetical protein
MNWIEAAGYAGTGFTIMSYSMRGMLRLRVAAVLSSASFLTYAGLMGSYPLIVMEVVLLPINGYRLIELLWTAPSDIAHPIAEAECSLAKNAGLDTIACSGTPRRMPGSAAHNRMVGARNRGGA